jgi:hypothetical protein
MASTSTASFSPKIKVDVIGSKPSASPRSFGRSPTIAFPGALKTFTLSLLDAVARALSFSSLVPAVWILLSMSHSTGVGMTSLRLPQVIAQACLHFPGLVKSAGHQSVDSCLRRRTLDRLDAGIPASGNLHVRR